MKNVNYFYAYKYRVNAAFMILNKKKGSHSMLRTEYVIRKYNDIDLFYSFFLLCKRSEVFSRNPLQTKIQNPIFSVIIPYTLYIYLFKVIYILSSSRLVLVSTFNKLLISYIIFHLRMTMLKLSCTHPP